MSKITLDYDSIRKYLKKVECSERLFPSTIEALELITHQPFTLKIQKTVISQIPKYIKSPGWVQQFNRDLKVFGLYEAILYFHTYPFQPNATAFVQEACELYHEIASAYLSQLNKIEESDDPRVHSRLSLSAYLGGNKQHIMNYSFTPIEKPANIPDPVKPPVEPGYRRKLPVDTELKSFMGNKLENPGNLANELIEKLTGKYMFRAFPGSQEVFIQTAKTIQKYDIHPFSATGQYILNTLCKEINDEYFGDFDRWVTCISCGKDLLVKINLSEANENLGRGGWVCKQCRE